MDRDKTTPGTPDDSTPATQQLHGVLIRVFGTGVLLIGESGIGKSESALDLITRGHQLVADDVVHVERTDDRLTGSAPELTFEMLEIRGLGFINIKQAFGPGSVNRKSSIDLCVELQKGSDFERPEEIVHHQEILKISIRKFVIPVSSGRNLATLIETAVRLHINREAGDAATERLLEKHAELIRSAH